MTRLFLAWALVAGCAQQGERVRKSSEAPSGDAGAAEQAQPAPDAGAEAAARSAATWARETSAALVRAPSGAQLLQLPLDQNAIVNVQLMFRAGAVDDPQGKAGLRRLQNANNT